MVLASAFPAAQPALPRAVRAACFACPGSLLCMDPVIYTPIYCFLSLLFLQLMTSRAQVPASRKLEAATGKGSCTHARLKAVASPPPLLPPPNVTHTHLGA